MPVDEETLKTFGASLERCNQAHAFLDRFYDMFLESSPKVREKFAKTDFVRQKAALRASLHAMMLAAQDNHTGLERHLHELAERHSSRQLDIGAELYDLWLDSLLVAVKESDPLYTPRIREAWERVMMVGISYLLKQY